ncbi:MAG: hypothetical protein U5J95_04595 [Balneolaceae bacterium]|nr:hypothetical protein [Balneolaceae bacterium]
MSISLVFSTLHSHHHIQWDHSGDIANTGNCFTKDTTVCPISGYLFQADITPPTSADSELSHLTLITEYDRVILEKDIESLVLGRAPPLVG